MLSRNSFKEADACCDSTFVCRRVLYDVYAMTLWCYFMSSWRSCFFFCADFTVTYLKMSPTAPFTFALSYLCVLLSIVSVVWATDIKINLDKRILPIPNSVTLKCTGFGSDMVDADFKIKREVDGQVTDFTDYTSDIEYDVINQPSHVASFTLTPDREGHYTCQVDQVTSSDSVVLIGESIVVVFKWMVRILIVRNV